MRFQFHALLEVEHTRLWSMISTIVASFPSEGPLWIRTMRPTSTSLHDDTLISASPIVIDSEVEMLVEDSKFAVEVRRRTGRCVERFIVVNLGI
jgi:hypothetical protein